MYKSRTICSVDDLQVSIFFYFFYLFFLVLKYKNDLAKLNADFSVTKKEGSL